LYIPLDINCGEVLKCDRVPGDSALVGTPKVDRRSGEGRGKPLNKGSAGLIVVEKFG
jgi:hypothetical protein